MNDNARARTAAITATLENLAWFKIPHTLDQIVGLHLEALGTGTMTFRYGATPGEMAATIKARAETGPAGRIGPPNPDASGRAAATHETLFGIDTTTADLAGLTGTKPNQLTDDLTKNQLLELAAQRGIDVKSTMNKAELRLAITKHST